MAQLEDQPASKDASTPWGLWLLVAAAAVVLLVIRPLQRQDDRLLNRPLPPLEAMGWLNADARPTAASLRGQVVLIDFWATWCGYCVAEMPELAELYGKYQNQGLVVVGLTPEMPQELPVISSYVSSVEGLDWPIGYGANITFDIMGIDALPTLVLFDRSGKSVWVGASLHGLEAAVIQALAAE